MARKPPKGLFGLYAEVPEELVMALDLRAQKESVSRTQKLCSLLSSVLRVPMIERRRAGRPRKERAT